MFGEKKRLMIFGLRDILNLEQLGNIRTLEKIFLLCGHIIFLNLY
jgi:hypothetical protein